jgi:hypothetical protein
MNKRDQNKRDQNKRDPDKRDHDREEPKRERGERKHREEPHGTGYGTERSVYQKYLARKWEGSAPPTPQAYARAIQLWRQLPGSIMTAPADLGTIPESTPGDNSGEPSQKHDKHDKHHENEERNQS